MTIPFHPFADVFRLIDGDEFDGLVADIKANGLRERIVVLDGQILDGRNRYRACVAAGLVDGSLPPDGDGLWISHYRRFLPQQDGDPAAFVLSLNAHRRHDSKSQIAWAVAELSRLRHGGDRRSPEFQDQTALVQVDRKKLADAAGVSERLVNYAAEAQKNAAPELGDAVRTGDVSVRAAAELSTLPVSEQLRILREKHPREFRAAVKEQRGETQAEKKDRRQAREAELGARQAALPDKRYGVILADPEWKFVPYSAETGMDRAADNHYPTSALEVIKSRPVSDIAADDCALLLWATVPMLPQALEVMAAWGFAYKSHVVWMKDQVGTGYWFRNQHELLLLGTRGSIPAPAMGDQFRSALAYPVSDHSAKPPFAHEVAEAYWPSLGKIELNARVRRANWDAWGLEAPEAVHAESEAIAMSFEEATPILQARYATSSGDELAALIGRPVGTVRTWAHKLDLTSAARLKGNASHLGDKLKRPKETVS